jgi:uncharacterized protein (AIM24 family)
MSIDNVADDPRTSVTADGWTELPPLADGSRYEFNGNIAQVEGLLAPVVDIRLTDGSGVMFDHHRLLWSTPDTRLRAGSSSGGYARMYAGLPSIMVHAEGPGQVGFSHHHHAGEVVAIPLNQGEAVAVHDGKMLVADNKLTMGYSNHVPWYRHVSGSNNDEVEYFYPLRQNIDVFIAEQGHSMLFLHSIGNAYTRKLAPGEVVCFAPGAFLAATANIRMDLVRWHCTQYFGLGASVLLEVTGPGTVWVESGAWHEVETHTDYGLRDVEGAFHLAGQYTPLKV